MCKSQTVILRGGDLFDLVASLDCGCSSAIRLPAKECIIPRSFPDKKYLVVVKSGIRLASVLSVACMGVHLISFSSDSMITHPVKYRQEDHFSFCEENGVESDCRSYITYSGDKKMLEYCYGNNYAYWMSLDIDTLRQGAFNYINGRFELVEETIRVNDRELDKK